MRALHLTGAGSLLNKLRALIYLQIKNLSIKQA